VSPNQHYVPRLLLKHFVFSGSRVYIFDKITGRSFSNTIESVASEPCFDDCTVDGAPFPIHQLLKRIEDSSAPIIDRIVEARSLRALGGSDRRMLALFAAVQMLRTKARREGLTHLIDDVRSAVEHAGIDPNKVQGFEFLDGKQTRVAAITSLPVLARELMSCLYHKYWILHSTTPERPFYISDNPVALFNLKEHPFLSTLGLRVPGIRVYLPISSTLCLGFLCPTIGVPWRTRLFGQTVELSPANVEHINSLQVLNSERFIYSQRDDFDLVRAVLQQIPEAKCGPRCA